MFREPSVSPEVYVNGTTGEVVQYTTFGKRLAAHVSAIPHWIYYTPLRKHQPAWLEFMIWSSLIGTIIAIVGIVVAVWMYSPRQKYKLAGKATGIPYRGQKRWHWILGMVFGVATVTWTFSGLLSLGPFPLVQRLTQTGPPAGQRGQQQQPQQVSTQEQEPAQQAPSDAARGVSVPEVTGAQAGSPRGGRQVGQRESLALYRLHSLNFPFLYNHRPLWDIVVITFMIGGTALCVTLLVLAWRVLGRKLKRAAAPADDVLTLEA